MPTPLFTLPEPAFEITGRGTAVVTGIAVTQPCPVEAQQSLVFARPNGVLTIARVTSIEYALIKTSESYGLMLSGISPADIPAGTQVYCHRSLVTGRDFSGKPHWTGDLDDDCTAIWAGLLLRAEEMDQHSWWWAVSDLNLNSAEVDSSNCHSDTCVSGLDARRMAEACAGRYLLSQ